MATQFVHEQWSSRSVFLLAAVGEAVGLGTIWRFPYITGQNGGGAFVLIYCGCILIIGIPLLMAELAIGRRGGQSAIKTMRVLSAAEGCSQFWQLLGWLSVLTPFVGLMFYSVVAGWILDYIFHTASGDLVQLTAADSNLGFSSLISNPARLAFWHGVFLLITVVIVAGGVKRGLERAVKILMPGLALILLILLGYVIATADFAGGVKFLFNPDFSKVDATVVLMAIGQAFFSLSVAVGAMITYGAYMPKHVSISNAACVIGIADTLTALLIGLVVFPLVLTYGLTASEGPGLVFVALPIAFGEMPAGVFFGTLFFLLMLMTALTSSIGMLEPVVSWIEEYRGLKRPAVAIMVGSFAWLCGLSAVLSFNVWSDVTPLAMFPVFEKTTIFELLDFVTANILIPLGGLLIALFAGWIMSRGSILNELGLPDAMAFRSWYLLVRYVAPTAIVAIFLVNMVGT